MDINSLMARVYKCKTNIEIIEKFYLILKIVLILFSI